MDLVIHSIWIGFGATLATDAWAWLRRSWFGVAPPDYGLVGRWFGYMPRGRFRHASIASAMPIRGERTIGWIAHYLTGIGFAAVLLAIAGSEWLRDPTLVPALAVGVATVAAPFLIMQPAFGAGIAARRAARPWIARLHSVLMHAVFGVGLYAAAAASVFIHS